MDNLKFDLQNFPQLSTIQSILNPSKLFYVWKDISLLEVPYAKPEFKKNIPAIVISWKWKLAIK